MFTYQFHSYVYTSVADVLDLLSLINCYVAFTVYVLTSSTYRETLVELLTRTVRCDWEGQKSKANSRAVSRKNSPAAAITPAAVRRAHKAREEAAEEIEKRVVAAAVNIEEGAKL